MSFINFIMLHFIEKENKILFSLLNLFVADKNVSEWEDVLIERFREILRQGEASKEGQESGNR